MRHGGSKQQTTTTRPTTKPKTGAIKGTQGVLGFGVVEQVCKDRTDDGRVSFSFWVNEHSNPKQVCSETRVFSFVVIVSLHLFVGLGTTPQPTAYRRRTFRYLGSLLGRKNEISKNPKRTDVSLSHRSSPGARPAASTRTTTTKIFLRKSNSDAHPFIVAVAPSEFCCAHSSLAHPTRSIGRHQSFSFRDAKATRA